MNQLVGFLQFFRVLSLESLVAWLRNWLTMLKTLHLTFRNRRRKPNDKIPIRGRSMSKNVFSARMSRTRKLELKAQRTAV